MRAPSTKSKPLLRLVLPGEPSPPAPESLEPLDPGATDRQLVARVRAGGATAARAFCDRVRPRVEFAVRSLLGHGDPDHDDLVQIAVVALIQGLDTYRGDCALDTWVWLIAARAVYKEIRRRRRARRVFATPVAEAPEPAAPANLSGAVLARDLAGRIRRHLEALGEDKAWTYLLHDVCGFTVDEIAQMTDVSVAAAQKRLVRARGELAERIAADPELSEFVKPETKS
jgi:RNA polymerase sigma-70 factor (ECF subfamily)